MLEREYLRESLSYVLAIQDVQERIKFEFVETLLGFMSGWLVFYHVGHDIAEEAREYMTDLRHKVQKVINHGVNIKLDHFHSAICGSCLRSIYVRRNRNNPRDNLYTRYFR